MIAAFKEYFIGTNSGWVGLNKTETLKRFNNTFNEQRDTPTGGKSFYILPGTIYIQWNDGEETVHTDKFRFGKKILIRKGENE